MPSLRYLHKFVAIDLKVAVRESLLNLQQLLDGYRAQRMVDDFLHVKYTKPVRYCIRDDPGCFQP
jgi:hypothetical protein